MGGKISDLLAADSLLLTILAVLYSVWYFEIDVELHREPALVPLSNKGDYERMRQVFFQRALPLTLAGVIVAAIFVPDSVHLAVPVVRKAIDGQRPRDYNAVSTALFVVTAATCGLAIHLLVRSHALWRNRRRFDPTLVANPPATPSKPPQ